MMRRATTILTISTAFTLAAVLPLYVMEVSRTPDYTVNLACDPIRFESLTFRVETVEQGGFVAIVTPCTLASLDRQEVGATAMLSTATVNTEGAAPIVSFDPTAFGEQTARVPGFDTAYFPVTLQPYEALSFPGVFVLPLPADWDDGSEACAQFAGIDPQPLSEAAQCLQFLELDAFRAYLEDLRDATRDHQGFSRFAIQVRFDNGDAAVSNLQLGRMFSAPRS